MMYVFHSFQNNTSNTNQTKLNCAHVIYTYAVFAYSSTSLTRAHAHTKKCERTREYFLIFDCVFRHRPCILVSDSSRIWHTYTSAWGGGEHAGLRSPPSIICFSFRPQVFYICTHTFIYRVDWMPGERTQIARNACELAQNAYKEILFVVQQQQHQQQQREGGPSGTDRLLQRARAPAFRNVNVAKIASHPCACLLTSNVRSRQPAGTVIFNVATLCRNAGRPTRKAAAASFPVLHRENCASYNHIYMCFSRILLQLVCCVDCTHTRVMQGFILYFSGFRGALSLRQAVFCHDCISIIQCTQMRAHTHTNTCPPNIDFISTPQPSYRKINHPARSHRTETPPPRPIESLPPHPQTKKTFALFNVSLVLCVSVFFLVSGGLCLCWSVRCRLVCRLASDS